MITIILSVIIVILLVVIGLLIKALLVQEKKNDIYEEWISETRSRVEATVNTMMDLDSRQIFVKDDEVGSVFAQLVELVKFLNQLVSKK